ncbi:MAG: S41 family peptidase, partial [Gemmatimonadaceae bacterium]
NMLWFGVVLDGTGDIWIDDVSIEKVNDGGIGAANAQSSSSTVGAPRAMVVDGGFETTQGINGVSQVPLDTARPASPAGLDAMIAFTRLAGYVRFFHPSDSVVATNWQFFLTKGIRAAEMAPTRDSLIKTLSNVFAGVAPTVRVFASNEKPPVPPSTKPTDTTALGLAWWSHRGVGIPTTANSKATTYSSTRIIQQSSDALPAGVSNPDTPLRVDLGAGVSALIPTTLWTKLPADEAKRRASPTQLFMGAQSANERSVRLAAVAELWMIMQHFYPYFDVVKVDWNKELRTTLSSAATDRTPVVFQNTLSKMLVALHDGHGNVFRAAQNAPGSYGIWLSMIEGHVMVTRVMDATRTDVRRGDVVLAIDNKPIGEVIAERSAITPGATRQFVEYRVTQSLMSGAVNDSVRFSLQSAKNANEPVRNVYLRAVPVELREDIPAESRPEKTEELKPGVMYVDMGRITDPNFASAMPGLLAATDIIFDLRGYPSFDARKLLTALSDTTIHSAKFELPLITQPDGRNVKYEDHSWNLAPTTPRIRAHVYFLTDGRAVSYAESTMGIVEYYKLGEIIGEPTAGTNGDVNPFVLPGDYRVVWTGLRVRKQDGSTHHGVGIQPTVLVHRTVKAVLEGRDEQLERALVLIAQRHALK